MRTVIKDGGATTHKQLAAVGQNMLELNNRSKIRKKCKHHQRSLVRQRTKNFQQAEKRKKDLNYIEK